MELVKADQAEAPRDALAQPVEDGRDIAMTYRSRRIFDRLGLWQRLPQDDIAPLKAAQVTDGDSPRPLRFDGRQFVAQRRQAGQTLFRPRVALVGGVENEP